MESRLIPHPLEWLMRIYKDTGKHATKETWKHNRTGIFAFSGREACERPSNPSGNNRPGHRELVPWKIKGIHKFHGGGGHRRCSAELKTVETLIRADFGERPKQSQGSGSGAV
jgi:hypothetical protein